MSWTTEKYESIENSIRGWGSFCLSYCSTVVSHGADESLALLGFSYYWPLWGAKLFFPIGHLLSETGRRVDVQVPLYLYCILCLWSTYKLLTSLGGGRGLIWPASTRLVVVCVQWHPFGCCPAAVMFPLSDSLLRRVRYSWLFLMWFLLAEAQWEPDPWLLPG